MISFQLAKEGLHDFCQMMEHKDLKLSKNALNMFPLFGLYLEIIFYDII